MKHLLNLHLLFIPLFFCAYMCVCVAFVFHSTEKCFDAKVKIRNYVPQKCPSISFSI